MSRKIAMAVDKIIAKHQNENDLTEILDRLKQKLAATAKRLTRYKKSRKRREDNIIFCRNHKHFSTLIEIL